jgi:hypothetical protein
MMCSGDCKVPETAVADTGPPLHLAQIEQESQLTIFMRSSISEQVRKELARRGVFDRVASALGDHLVVESVTLPEQRSGSPRAYGRGKCGSIGAGL